MEIVPLSAVPVQTVTVTLANQNCQITVYEKQFSAAPFLVTGGGLQIDDSGGDALVVSPNLFTAPSALFVNLSINNALIIAGVIGLNGVRIVRDAYLGFIGDLAFYDVSGLGQDPTSAGLGTQFQLVYLD